MQSTSRRDPTIWRRRFTLAAGATCLAVAAGTPATAEPVSYGGLQSDRFLGPARVETRIEDVEIFTEGPAVNRQGNVFFTNVAAGKILKWDPTSKSLSVFRDGSNKANGLYFDPRGRLLACEGGAGRVTRTRMDTGRIEVLAARLNGKPFAAPNDLCMDSKGRVYFTSRSGVEDRASENPKGVYRIDPDGRVVPLLQPPRTHMPNGIVISPDETTLYVIEAHPDADHHRHIRAHELQADGSLGAGRVLFDFYPGRGGDGMCIDQQGNLYVAAGLHALRGTSETLDTKPGVHVISPRGKLLAYRETPEDTVTNCTFGGADLRTLYVTCGTKLVSIRTTIPGKATYRPGGDGLQD